MGSEICIQSRFRFTSFSRRVEIVVAVWCFLSQLNLSSRLSDSLHLGTDKHVCYFFALWTRSFLFSVVFSPTSSHPSKETRKQNKILQMQQQQNESNKHIQWIYSIQTVSIFSIERLIYNHDTVTTGSHMLTTVNNFSRQYTIRKSNK